MGWLGLCKREKKLCEKNAMRKIKFKKNLVGRVWENLVGKMRGNSKTKQTKQGESGKEGKGEGGEELRMWKGLKCPKRGCVGRKGINAPLRELCSSPPTFGGSLGGEGGWSVSWFAFFVLFRSSLSSLTITFPLRQPSLFHQCTAMRLLLCFI